MSPQQLCFRFKSYLAYRLKAKGITLLHSPSLFALYTRIKELRKDKELPIAYAQYLSTIKRLGRGKQLKRIGIGAVKDDSSIGFIPYHLRTKMDVKYLMVMQALVEHCQSGVRVLELGTGTGSSTEFFAQSPNVCRVVSVDANWHVIHSIRPHLSSKVETINATFDEVLPGLLEQDSFDLILIDGDHCYESTLRYYQKIKESKVLPEFIVFDDIRWSKGMFQAWQVIKNEALPAYYLDFGRLGVIWNKHAVMPQEFHLK